MKILLLWIATLTVVTFAAYGIDKLQARRGRRRISERSLLIMTLVGGTIGALVAMPLFRHKTVKGSFRVKLALVLILQLAAVVGGWWVVSKFSAGNREQRTANSEQRKTQAKEHRRSDMTWTTS